MTDLRAWPALVLTAGLATRLRPLSDVRAKAAMPVAGEAIIARILRWLRSHGVRRAVLNLHHKPESITAIVGDGAQFDLDVRYSWERALLGSAGGPRHALPLLDSERFLIINGDTMTNCNLQAVVDRHKARGARVTMAGVVGDVQRYGGMLLDANDQVRGFGKPTSATRALHFIGVQAVEADVFAPLADDVPAETVRGMYPEMIRTQGDAIRVFESDAEFLDVGTARDYLSSVEIVATREQRPFDVGENCSIAAGARLERTVLWDGVSIGSGARLTHCIVADGVAIEPGAEYVDTVFVNTPAGIAASTL
jgi:NDP-sugar pyrophosphorylase family protein